MLPGKNEKRPEPYEIGEKTEVQNWGQKGEVFLLRKKPRDKDVTPQRKSKLFFLEEWLAAAVTEKKAGKKAVETEAGG